MSSITMTDDTPTNVTYGLVSAKGNEMILRDTSSSLDTPRLAQFSSQISNSANGTDRHLIKMTRTDDDADGNPITGSVHTVIALPREAVSSANLQLQWEMMKNYIDANWDSIVGGFLPDAV